MNLWSPGKKDVGRDTWRVWDGHGHTAVFNMENPQGPAVQHRQFCSISCGSMDGRGVCGRRDTCVCRAESLCCPPETITTLLMGYTPIWNKKFNNNINSPSVVSDSLRPHGLEPTRLLCPRDSLDNNAGVGCHFLLQAMFLTKWSNPGLLHWQVDLFFLFTVLTMTEKS